MDYFDPHGVKLGSCPQIPELQKYLSYPSVSFIFFLLALFSLLFAMFTCFKYNSVMVFNKPVRKSQISNTLWIFYFITIFLRATTESIKFAVIHPDQSYIPSIDLGLVVTSLVFYGLSSFSLTLALDHQRKYRSDYGIPKVPPEAVPHTQASAVVECDSTPLINDQSSLNYVLVSTTVKSALFSSVTLYVFLLLLYGLGLYGVFMSQNILFFGLFMATYGLQRLPIVILMIWIVFSTGKTINLEGPTLKSKSILCFATLLELANNLPVTIWAEIIKDDKCPLKIFSFVDIIHLLFCTAQILFFIFLRTEFQRNKDQFVYQTVQTHKDYEQIGIEWRKFEEPPPQSNHQ